MRVRPSTWRLLSTWGVSGEIMKFIEISMPAQLPKKSPNWCPKASKSDQNEIQTGTWNHQNQETVKKMKSNENLCFFYVFERLGHQESEDFPIKSHQDSCLQSEHDFWCLKSCELGKSDPKVTPTGHPKIIKNRWKPEQQGNGKRGMRNEAQQEWIPGYSWACPDLPNHSKCFPLDLMFIYLVRNKTLRAFYFVLFVKVLFTFYF